MYFNVILLSRQSLISIYPFTVWKSTKIFLKFAFLNPLQSSQVSSDIFHHRVHLTTSQLWYNLHYNSCCSLWWITQPKNPQSTPIDFLPYRNEWKLMGAWKVKKIHVKIWNTSHLVCQILSSDVKYTRFAINGIKYADSQAWYLHACEEWVVKQMCIVHAVQLVTGIEGD